MPKAKTANGTPRPASGPVTLLVGTRKGAFFIRSDRARRSWTLAGPHFLGNIVNHLVLDRRDGKTLLCAVRAGHLGPTVFRSTDFGRTWKEAQRPPAFPKAAPGEKGLAVEHVFWLTPGHASQPGAWYAGVSPPGLFRSEDGGVTWEGVVGFNANPMRSPWIGGEQEQGPPDGATLHSINVDPRDPGHLYIGISVGGAFESTDGGASWRPLNKGVAADFLPVKDPEYGHDVHCMRLHPLAPDRLYQQNHCGIYRLDRLAERWQRIGSAMPKAIAGPRSLATCRKFIQSRRPAAEGSHAANERSHPLAASRLHRGARARGSARRDPGGAARRPGAAPPGDPIPHDRRAGRDPAPHQDLRQPAADARFGHGARRERRSRHRRRLERRLIPEILELQRNVGDRLAHERNRGLEIVLLGARDAHGGSLDARLDLHLRVLDHLHDALRLLLLDAGLDVDRLLHLGAADLLDALRIEHPRVDAALGTLGQENVGHLLQLEIVVRVERQHQLGLLDARVRALEIEAVRDLLVRLVDRVLQLDLVHFGDDIEGGHFRLPRVDAELYRPSFPLQGKPELRCKEHPDRRAMCRFRLSRKQTLDPSVRNLTRA